MWVFEELEGHVFCGKTLLLKPGARILFGRTLKNGGGQFIILDKTVSRKQSIVEVAPIGNATIQSPPEVTITDVGSKYGTFIDGKQIYSKTPLLKTCHIIQLGRCKSHFRISWVTVPSDCPFVIKERIHGQCTSLYRRLTHPDQTASKRHESTTTEHFFAKKGEISIVLKPLRDGVVAVKKIVVISVTPLHWRRLSLTSGNLQPTDLKSLYPLWLACNLDPAKTLQH